MPILGSNYKQIGLRTDDEAVNSIFGNLYQLKKHIHGASYCYPTLGAGVQLTAGDGWALGSAALIMIANTAANPFDIHFVNIEVLSANAIYELQLFKDLACTLFIGKCRFTRVSNNEAANGVPIMTSIVQRTNPIYGKLASNSNGAQATISIFYHEY